MLLFTKEPSITIEGKKVRLSGGRYEEQIAEGSATKIESMVFGRPVKGDLDGDGDEALFLLQTHGGSGTFSKVAAAINRDGTHAGTTPYLGHTGIEAQFIKGG